MNRVFCARSLGTALLVTVAWALSPVALRASDEEHAMVGEAPDKASRRMGVDTQITLEATLAQQELAKSIGLDVVCLCGTCPKRTITECDCGWAGQNRTAILNAVVKGMNREQIVGAYREVYGQQVLAMLPLEGVNWLALILPYASALVGLGAVGWIGFRLARRGPSAATNRETAPGAAPADPADTAARAELERKLEDLD